MESPDSHLPQPGTPPPGGTADFVRKFNEYKLETEFHGDNVVHRTYKWERSGSRRLWETSTWKKKRKIGSGNFGTVWLQEREGEEGEEQLRAVKMISRDSLPQAGRSQELLALVKLGGVSLETLCILHELELTGSV